MNLPTRSTNSGLRIPVRLITTAAVAFGAFIATVTIARSQQSAYPFHDPNRPVEKRLDNLLSVMTLDEKISCLGTQTAIPRLGVAHIGSSEGIHGVVQRGGGKYNETVQIPLTASSLS